MSPECWRLWQQCYPNMVASLKGGCQLVLPSLCPHTAPHIKRCLISSLESMLAIVIFLNKYGKSGVIGLPESDNKKPCRFPQGILKSSLLRCSTTKPSCCAVKSPSHMERPCIVILVDWSSFAPSQLPALSPSCVREPPSLCRTLKPHDDYRHASTPVTSTRHRRTTQLAHWTVEIRKLLHAIEF